MRVYRYLEKQHVESFFETGSLMLSSFERCRRLECSRGDVREGKANFFISAGSKAISGMFNTGDYTHILSTSRALSERIMHKFKVDDYFIIKRPGHFSHSISECLQDVHSAHLGNCIYSDHGFETSSPMLLDEAPNNFSSLSESEQIRWFERYNENMQEAMQKSLNDRGLFTKRHADYHDEQEFRFAWTMNKPVEELKLINCKEAIRYCVYR